MFRPLTLLLSVYLCLSLLPSYTFAKQPFYKKDVLTLFNNREVEPFISPLNYKKISVSTSQQLYQAINRAHHNNGQTLINLSSGHYSLTNTINIHANNITIIGNSRSPSKVVLTGNDMKPIKSVDNLFRVSGDNFHIEGVTLEQSGNHLIQIAGANSPIIKNVIFRDSYEQLLKISYNNNFPHVFSSNGSIENCLFYYSAGIGPNYYIGGIDGHAVQNWKIKNNIFKSIASPSNHIAEHAIHLWNGSKNNTVTNNIIIDSDRAIGFGMRHHNNEQGAFPSNVGGEISKNIIYHSMNNHSFADVGIIIEDSPDTIIKGNLIYLQHPYPNAIEFRYGLSLGVEIINNIVNKGIRPRDSASAILHGNLTIKTERQFISHLEKITR